MFLTRQHLLAVVKDSRTLDVGFKVSRMEGVNLMHFAIFRMGPKTSAQRMREYRSRMSGEKKKQMLEKNREQQKCSRMTWTPTRKKQESVASKERMRKSRLLKTLTPPGSPTHVYGSVQSLGKAMSKVTAALPKSPRRKVAVVKVLARRIGLPLKRNETPKVISPPLLARTIGEFYESDIISRQLPGRKDYITVVKNGRKERVQKKILMTTVMEAFQQFKLMNPDVKIGKSKFANLRPKNVVPITEKDHTVCCCSYHENFEMLFNGIGQLQGDLPGVGEIIAMSSCTENIKCKLGECEKCKDVVKLVDEIFNSVNLDPETPCLYLQWTAEYRKIQINTTLSSARDEVLKQLPVMRHHAFIAKNQLHQIKTLKENLKDGEAVLQEDFSENFQIKQQDEIMAAHWVSNGVTIFTAVINTKTAVQSIVVISDELHHDKYSVLTFNRSILEAVSGDGSIIDLHIFTDGANSQFKNRFTLSNLVRPQLINPNLKTVDWSFFGTAHGKGPVDGVGGTVKRTVWRRILQKRAFLNNPEEFAAVAREACPNIIVLYVSSQEIEKVRDELNKLWENDMPLPIPDTRSAHYFRPCSDHELEISAVSPFLSEVEAQIEYRKAPIFRRKKPSTRKRVGQRQI
jgi:hypothetical protein